MAALILDGARAARDDAQQLRADSLGLRLSARRGVRRSHAAITAAGLSTTAAQARRAQPVVSPWSGLHWARELESVERVLVPVD